MRGVGYQTFSRAICQIFLAVIMKTVWCAVFAHSHRHLRVRFELRGLPCVHEDVSTLRRCSDASFVCSGTLIYSLIFIHVCMLGLRGDCILCAYETFPHYSDVPTLWSVRFVYFPRCLGVSFGGILPDVYVAKHSVQIRRSNASFIHVTRWSTAHPTIGIFNYENIIFVLCSLNLINVHV